MGQFRLTEDDSADIEFATACLVVGAITFSEFKQWLCFVAENAEDVPLYVFQLTELNDVVQYLSNVASHLGFSPAFLAPTADTLALLGIAVLRFKNFQLGERRCKEAIAALLATPAVEEQFRQTFPFIDF